MTFVQPGDPIKASLFNQLIEQTQRVSPPNESKNWLSVYNDTGETIPVGSVFTFEGGDESAWGPVPEVKQGGGDLLFTNGLYEIADGASGPAMMIRRGEPIRVACSETGITAGDSLGPNTSDWEVHASGSGLIALSDVDTAADTIWVTSPGGGGSPVRIATTENIISAATESESGGVYTRTPGGPVSVQPQVINDSGEFEDDGDTVSCYNWSFTDTPDPDDQDSGLLWVLITQMPDGYWEVIGWDCTQVAASIENDTGTNMTLTGTAAATGMSIAITYEGVVLATGICQINASSVANSNTVGIRITLMDGTTAKATWDWWTYKTSASSLFDIPFSLVTSIPAASVDTNNMMIYIHELTTHGTVTLVGSASSFDLTGPIK